MKTRILAIVLLATVPIVALGASGDISATLQKGLFEEEANRNLDAAIQAYQSVITQFDKDRQLAATVIFRLAECYRKLGKTNEAVGQYQRVLTDFSDQATLVNLSRQNLVGLGATTSVPAPALSKSGRAEQRRLLQEEIRLLEQVVERLPTPPAPGSGVERRLGFQREVFNLRRQLAALEDEPTGASAADTTPATTDEEQKEVQRIKALMKDSPDLINAHETGGVGGTPLHNAARAGHLTVAQFLLANGADVNGLDSERRTPLHGAASRGHKSLVELLLTNQADANAKNKYGDTPLHVAADNGHRLVVGVLLANKADVNSRNAGGWTPLHFAAGKNYMSVAEELLKHKADLNVASTGNQYYVDSQYQEGLTPLHLAARRNNPAMIEWLCAHGADVNVKESHGDTPLYLLAANGSKSAIEALLAKKADVNVKNNSDTTPLLIASGMPSADVVALLLAHGADVNAQDNFSRLSSVHRAVGQKSKDVLNVLLTARPNLEIRDRDGYTPLQKAVGSKSDEMVEMLLAAGANPNVVVESSGSSGDTPLHWAAQTRWKKIVELLLAHGADVNAQNVSGLTPLDYVNTNPDAAKRIGIKPSPEEEARLVEVGNLLRKAGAKEDLRRSYSIGIRRDGREVQPQLFYRGTNSYNRYTLFEAIAYFYQKYPPKPPNNAATLSFPDFTRVQVNRMEPKQNKTKDINVDVTTILKSGDCSHDVWMEWGDVVDIPEQDHPINEQWRGLTGEISDALRKCLERSVTVGVKGQSTTLKLVPQLPTAPRPGELPTAVPRQVTIGTVSPSAPRTLLSKFRLREVIYDAGVLRAASDVTRVTVKRVDPITKEKQELLFNLDKVDPQTDLWLRDGDVIEIPEK